jgi:hypothetical protein
MARWRAQIKVTDSGSFFNVEVVAGSSSTAKETIQKIYKPILIYNLYQISSRDNPSTETTEVTPGMYWFVGSVFLLYLIVTYWYIVIPASIIIGLLLWWVKN